MGSEARKRTGAPHLPVRRPYLMRLATCVIVRVAIVCVMGLGYGSSYALMHFVAGAEIVPASGGGPSLVGLVASLAPTALFVYLFSDYLRSGLEDEASLVLSRSVTRARWSLVKLEQIVSFSLVYALAGDLLSCLGLLALQPDLALGWLAGTALGAGALDGLLLCALLVIVNTASLHVDTVVAYAVTAGSHVGALAALAFAPFEVGSLLAPWLPSAQGVLAWHDCSAWGPGLPSGAKGFGVGGSVVYLFVLTAIAACLAVLSVRRHDVV